MSMITTPAVRAALLTPLIVAGAVLTGCTTFTARVAEAQKAIEKSFMQLGYGPRDIEPSYIPGSSNYSSTLHTMRGRTWMERQVRFRDHQDRKGAELTKFFRQDAKFAFEHELTIGDSESDIEKIRWYEFKLDQFYTVYRIEFVRPALPLRGGSEHEVSVEERATPSLGVFRTGPDQDKPQQK